jgi:hypothetical protein
LVIGFTELSELVTINKAYAVTVLHISQVTIGHARSSQSLAVFTSRCLLAASMAHVPIPLVSRTVPVMSYQLLTETAPND